MLHFRSVLSTYQRTVPKYIWCSEYLSVYLSRLSPVAFAKGDTLPVNFGTVRRLRTHLEDAGRSMVSTFEEGWARPSTKEFLDFIGFSQASLIEIHGDIDRSLADGLLKPERESTGGYGNVQGQHAQSTFPSRTSPVPSCFSPMARAGIPTPSRDFPYPPVRVRTHPTEYGSTRERLREYTGHEVSAGDLSYELFIECINKCSYLLRHTVEGLWRKLSRDEQELLREKLNNLWSQR